MLLFLLPNILALMRTYKLHKHISDIRLTFALPFPYLALFLYYPLALAISPSVRETSTVFLLDKIPHSLKKQGIGWTPFGLRTVPSFYLIWDLISNHLCCVIDESNRDSQNRQGIHFLLFPQVSSAPRCVHCIQIWLWQVLLKTGPQSHCQSLVQ